MTVIAPPLRRAQADAWHALFEVHERIPVGWALVGGQMIQSLCWERGAPANRPTVDADTALDIRAHPRMLMTFTSVLRDIGFEPDGTSFEGHQHRWTRGEARIDVLIPRFLGERADRRRGVGGGTTISAPGTQGALDRSMDVRFRVEDREGTIRRPTLQGAILSKAAAVEIPGDDSTRHLVDIATLGTLVTRRDRVGDGITAVERTRALSAAALLRRDPAYARMAGVETSVAERLRLAFATPARPAGRAPGSSDLRRDPGRPTERDR
ncbi:hypothetical protein BFL35_14910 [Clavibacter michiganensis]|nr:hypothetical protein BFL35_14910 [Clavibacter michiganensis]